MIISITGIDGCGKSTQVKNLIENLNRLGYETYLSKAYDEKEKEIFENLLPTYNQKAILFLFQALHVQQFQSSIKAENEGKIVVADRWDDSYLVYHSTNGVLSKKPKLLQQINELAFEKKKPETTFYLDVDIPTILNRLKIRGESFLEKKPPEFFIEMRKSYLKLAKKENWVVVNGVQSIDEISQFILNHVHSILL
jgi:dTMP kinase